MICSEYRTCDGDENSIEMKIEGLFERVNAAVVNPNVSALILVIQTDEFLIKGLPLECVDSVRVVDLDLRSYQSSHSPLSEDIAMKVREEVLQWTRR